MMFKTAFILITFLFSFVTINELRKSNTLASDHPDSMIAHANSTGSQNPASLPSAQDARSAASLRVEPLLLLLLGSTLFAVGTAIKLVLSRKITPKSIAAVTRKPPSAHY